MLVGVSAVVLVAGSDAVRSLVGSTVLALLVVLGPVEEVDSKCMKHTGIDVQNNIVICVAITMFQYCIVWPYCTQSF